ncbi:MAG: histidine kinase [Mycobacterium sp.]|nr:histidine kinase [Mycobacterium sp.]
MRHSANIVIAIVTLANPHSDAQPMGKWLLGVLACWGAYRIATRSQRGAFTAVDYLLTLAVCAAIPLPTTGADFAVSYSAPQAVAITAAVSFAVALPPRLSILMAVSIAAALMWSGAAVGDWADLRVAGFVVLVQAAITAVIRVMLLRLAAAADRARADREAAEVNKQVADAVRDYDREQLALLHDTAASTLLLVGKGTPLPPERLAAQATRDLQLLAEGPQISTPPIELVAALRQHAAHVRTPLRFAGRDEVWLDGETGKAVVAAAREAMTNVDRHARATWMYVAVGARYVVVSDDGLGFAPGEATAGHGIADSITARMQRAGCQVDIRSAPGCGTSVELSWQTEPQTPPRDPEVTNPDRQIDRVRIGFALALTSYAVFNLVASAPYSLADTSYPVAQIALAALAVVSSLAALPGILWGRWRPAVPAAAALLVVAALQPVLLDRDSLYGPANWSWYSIGWCLLPLLLGLPAPLVAAVVAAYWAVMWVANLMLDSSAPTWLYLGLGTGSILVLQLCSLVAYELMGDAAEEAQAEARAHLEVRTRQRVAEALRADYRRRYAGLAQSVVPLLIALSRGGPVDSEMQRNARAESQRMRALFDQSATFDHALLRRLRPPIDAAMDRSVDVVLHVDCALPAIDDDDIDALVAPVAEILQNTATAARIVLTATADEVVVSVVFEGWRGLYPVEHAWPASDDDVNLVTLNGTAWFTVRHAVRAGRCDPIFDYEHVS